MLGGWIDRDRMQADFDQAARRSEFLSRAHLLAGLFFVFFVSWPMTFAELAVVPLAVVSALRLFIIWRCIRWTFVQPLTIVAAAWMAFLAMSLLWSRDRSLGFNEFGVVRFGVYGLLLFPLLARRNLLIGALAAGLLAGNIAQFANHIGVRFNVSWLVIKPFEDRNGGWWAVVFGGQVLLCALGLHLPAAVMGHARTRLIALACALVTLLGIFATGTRTAWIGAGIIITAAVVIGVLRGSTFAARVRLGLGAVAAVLVASAVIAMTVGPEVSRRFEAAWEEVRRALNHADYDSDNGARLMMKSWAWQAFKESPIVGHGIGSYPEYVKERFADESGVYQRFVESHHAHAHDAVLTTLADSGVIGLLFAVGVTSVALAGAAAGQTRKSIGTYSAGPLFAICAMLTTVPFDVIHINATTGSLLWVVTALSPAARPREIDVGSPAVP